MRSGLLAVCAMLVIGCPRSSDRTTAPPRLDIGSARTALIERVERYPAEFLSYAEPEHLETLRHAEPVPESGYPEGIFHLGTRGEAAGPLRLTGFMIDLNGHTYSASRYTVEVIAGGETDHFVDHLNGQFTYDVATRKWQATAPYRVEVNGELPKK